jgi:signal transduction histidine kinase
MTDIVLWLVPLLAAAMFLLRAIRERKARIQLQHALREARKHAHEHEELQLRFLGIVAHELRSPLSAIMGYQELLSDGIYGPLDERALEALARINHSSRQLLTLTDGMEEFAGRKETTTGESLPIDFTPVLQDAITEAQRESASRGITFDVEAPPHLAPINTNLDRARNTLDLLLHAALKLSTGKTLRLTVSQTRSSTDLTFSGKGLDRYPLPAGDADLTNFPIDSGSALRLAIALRMARSIGATLTANGKDDNAALKLRIPAES